MTDLLRVYFDPAEIHSTTGYPYAWFQHQSTPEGEVLLPIKDLIREIAGHRCERCGHPYRKGEHGNGQWSACDELCTHPGPIRVWSEFGRSVEPSPTILGAHDIAAEIDGGFDVDAEWRILTVHHLDGVKHNCRWWNLAALCQRCHLTIQGKVYMDREYPFAHSEWFKPHAAGFYAVKYLGVDLDREETAARLDELLALEQTHEPLF